MRTIGAWVLLSMLFFLDLVLGEDRLEKLLDWFDELFA